MLDWPPAQEGISAQFKKKQTNSVLNQEEEEEIEEERLSLSLMHPLMRVEDHEWTEGRGSPQGGARPVPSPRLENQRTVTQAAFHLKN